MKNVSTCSLHEISLTVGESKALTIINDSKLADHIRETTYARVHVAIASIYVRTGRTRFFSLERFPVLFHH